MVGPAAKREAVTHLKVTIGLSERRACQIISADRKTVRYRSSRPPELELRTKLRDLANEPMSGGASATDACSFCFGEMVSLPVSIASTGSIARKVFPCASGRPGVVLSARVRRSSSQQRPMHAGLWISSTINSPAAGAFASSMWSTTSRANAWRQSQIRRSLAVVLLAN